MVLNVKLTWTRKLYRQIFNVIWSKNWEWRIFVASESIPWYLRSFIAQILRLKIAFIHPHAKADTEVGKYVLLHGSTSGRALQSPNERATISCHQCYLLLTPTITNLYSFCSKATCCRFHPLLKVFLHCTFYLNKFLSLSNCYVGNICRMF